jgi:pimeloyl-ACP methyl ester carboxylesterase
MPQQHHGEKWLDVAGIRTRYLDVGSGPSVLFLHGGEIGDQSFAGSAEDWEFNLGAVAEAGYRAIAVDLLGQGHTDNPQCDDNWSPRAQISHAVQFVHSLGCAPVHLVGHSHGGYIACRLTQEHPRLVQSCTIVSSDACAPGTSRSELMFAINPYAAGMRDATAWILQRSSFAKEHISEAWLNRIHDTLRLEKSRAAIRKMNIEGMIDQVFSVVLRRDRENMFLRLQHEALLRPVMLIWGFNDPIAPIEMGYRLAKLVGRHQPRAHLFIVNKAGHFCHRERPAEVNRVLVEFLEGVAHGV